jgi:hypothetical protein
MPNQNVCNDPATPAQIVGAQPVPRSAAGATAMAAHEAVAHYHEHRLERLIDRLPNAMQAPTRWLRRPSSRWVRIPAGVLLVGGGVLSILPFLGI